MKDKKRKWVHSEDASEEGVKESWGSVKRNSDWLKRESLSSLQARKRSKEKRKLLSPVRTRKREAKSPPRDTSPEQHRGKAMPPPKKYRSNSSVNLRAYSNFPQSHSTPPPHSSTPQRRQSRSPPCEIRWTNSISPTLQRKRSHSKSPPRRKRSHSRFSPSQRSHRENRDRNRRKERSRSHERSRNYAQK